MAVQGSINRPIPVKMTASAVVGDPENANLPNEAQATLEKIYTIKKSKGQTEPTAKSIVMTSSALAVTYSGAGKLEPANQTLTFTINKKNTTAVPGWGVAPFGGAAVSNITDVLSSGNGDSVKMTAAQFEKARGTAQGIHVSASVDGMIERCSVLFLQSAAIDAEVIKEPGVKTPVPAIGTTRPVEESPQFVAVLTNETHILATDSAGNGGNFAPAGGTMRVFDGTTEVTTTRKIVYSVDNVSEGLSIEIDSTTGVYKVTGLTTDTGTARIKATYSEDEVSGGGAIPEEGIAGGAGDGTAEPIPPSEDFMSCRAKYGISEMEAEAMENEFSAHPFGTSAEGLAQQRAMEAGGADGASPFDPGTNASQAEPAGCAGTAGAGDKFQLSKRFKVEDLSSHNPNPHFVGDGNRRAGRAAIICNMRHLAVNILEKLCDHFEPLGYKIIISHGYRGKNINDSDHCIGSAVDLIFQYNGRRIGGQHLTRVQMCIDQHLKLPYTQMIHEVVPNGNLLHIACRRVGGNSGKRNGWSPSNGRPMYAGYKHTVQLDGNPRVR